MHFSVFQIYIIVFFFFYSVIATPLPTVNVSQSISHLFPRAPYGRDYKRGDVIWAPAKSFEKGFLSRDVIRGDVDEMCAFIVTRVQDRKCHGLLLSENAPEPSKSPEFVQSHAKLNHVIYSTRAIYDKAFKKMKLYTQLVVLSRDAVDMTAGSTSNDIGDELDVLLAELRLAPLKRGYIIHADAKNFKKFQVGHRRSFIFKRPGSTPVMENSVEESCAFLITEVKKKDYIGVLLSNNAEQLLPLEYVQARSNLKSLTEKVPGKKGIYKKLATIPHGAINLDKQTITKISEEDVGGILLDFMNPFQSGNIVWKKAKYFKEASTSSRSQKVTKGDPEEICAFIIMKIGVGVLEGFILSDHPKEPHLPQFEGKSMQVLNDVLGANRATQKMLYCRWVSVEQDAIQVLPNLPTLGWEARVEIRRQVGKYNSDDRF